MKITEGTIMKDLHEWMQNQAGNNVDVWFTNEVFIIRLSERFGKSKKGKASSK